MRTRTAIATAALALLALTGSGIAAPAVVPQNTAAPTISGTAQAGQTLTADAGSWQSSSNVGYSFQWRRCDKNGSGCANLDQQTDKLYTVRHGDVGRTLRVVVTAVNGDGAASAVSKPTDVVTAAPQQAPVNTALPAISGTAEEDRALNAGAGTWNGTNPVRFSYRWRLCDAKGGDCSSTGVTSQTYKLASGDVGHTLRVLVRATNPGGSSAAISDPTAVVTAKANASTGLPDGASKLPNGSISIPASSVSLPQRLIVDQIQYTPGRITDRSQPLVARFHVVDTRGYAVRDALVYAVGVPFDRLSKAPEATTGQDGWATVTFQIMPTFQLRPGSLVVIFVRARKSGDNVLAGVSTRRLVSVRVG